MALVETKTCVECGITKSEVWNYSGTCWSCALEIKEAKYKKSMEYLDSLTMEERVRRIEAWMYGSLNV